MKVNLIIAALIGATALSASAANYNISNVVNGTNDTLYANNNNSLNSGGIVTLGTFTAGFDVAAAVASKNFAGLVSNFTILASGVTGTTSGSLGGSFAGYVESPTVDGPAIIAGNALLGQTLYSFVGNFSTLQLSIGENGQIALLNMGLIKDDESAENDYSANPQARVGQPVIGTFGTISGNLGGQGQGTFDTLQLVPVVPEPSVALLGALGVLGLVRRRR